MKEGRGRIFLLIDLSAPRVRTTGRQSDGQRGTTYIIVYLFFIRLPLYPRHSWKVPCRTAAWRCIFLDVAVKTFPFSSVLRSAGARRKKFSSVHLLFSWNWDLQIEIFFLFFFFFFYQVSASGWGRENRNDECRVGIRCPTQERYGYPKI